MALAGTKFVNVTNVSMVLATELLHVGICEIEILLLQFWQEFKSFLLIEVKDRQYVFEFSKFVRSKLKFALQQCIPRIFEEMCYMKNCHNRPLINTETKRTLLRTFFSTHHS
jgi:hypothetical protein